MIRLGDIQVKKHILNLLVVLALLGQPNGLFLLVPLLNVVLTAYILFSLLISLKLSVTVKLEFVVFLAIICIFLLYSAFSLTYAQDPGFGLRILSSVVFKVFTFLAIVLLIRKEEEFKGTLKTIMYTTAFFSTTGVILTLAIIVLHLQPTMLIGEVSVGGNLSYDQALSFYFPLGFVRASQSILDIVYPRLQSFFIEPGYFAFSLELGIFSTLGLIYLTPGRARRYKLCLAVQVMALAMSLSLAGVASVILGYFFMQHFKRGGLLLLNGLRYVGISLLGAVGCIAVFYLVAPGLCTAIFRVLVLERFSVEWGNSSADVRADVFKMGVMLWKQSPVLGQGFNQVRVVAEGKGTNNSFLTIAAEGGIIGLTIYIMLTAYVIARAVKNVYIARRKHPAAVKTLSAICAGLIAMTFHCVLMDTNWTFIYWIMIALIFASYNVYSANSRSPEIALPGPLTVPV